MSKDTPRKKRRREKLVKKFSEDWEVDYTRGPTIYRIKTPGVKGFFKNLFARKHSVFAMYWYFKHDRLENEDSRKFHFPIKHDNIPVAGVPFKYELQGTWNIEDDDLKYLYGGPLIDQHAELLVPIDAGIPKAQRIVKMLTPFIAFVTVLILLLVRVLQLLAVWPW